MATNTNSINPAEANSNSVNNDPTGLPHEYLEALQDFLDSEASMYGSSDTDDIEYLSQKAQKPKLMEDYEKAFYQKYKLKKALEDLLNDQSSGGGALADETEDDVDDYDEEDERRIETSDDTISIPKPIIDSLSWKTDTDSDAVIFTDDRGIYYYFSFEI